MENVGIILIQLINCYIVEHNRCPGVIIIHPNDYKSLIDKLKCDLYCQLDSYDRISKFNGIKLIRSSYIEEGEIEVY